MGSGVTWREAARIGAPYSVVETLAMQVVTRLRLPDLRIVDLAPEAVIGRMRSAALRLNDPAISEAHAMVSLRGSELKLLALRGRFMVDGVQAAEVTLRPGQRIELGADIELTVVSVSIPPEILGIRAPDLPLQVLPPVASILVGSGDIASGYHPNAAAVLWVDGELVHARLQGGPEVGDRTLGPGEALDVADRTYVIETMKVGEAASPATQRGRLDTPLEITLLYDSVHIARGGEIACIDGIPARILCELAELGGPVEWRVVAHQVWPREGDEALLRRNWDSGLSRLRRALVEQGLRSDLVRAAGRGRVELFLGPKDRVDDRQ